MSSSSTNKSAGARKDAKWTTGDVTLISSDNVSFVVDGYILMGGSIVFKNLIAGFPQKETDRTLSLTDNDIETAEVLHIFLDLCSLQEPANIFDSDKFALMMNTIRFMTKYDCPTAFRALALMASRAFVQQRVTHIIAFTIAALVDDLSLAASIVSADSKNDNILLGFDTYHYNPKGGDMMPFETFKIIPINYVYGLFHACILKTQGAELKNVAEAFEKKVRGLSTEPSS